MGLDPILAKLVYAAERSDMVYEKVMNGNRASDRYSDSKIEERINETVKLLWLPATSMK